MKPRLERGMTVLPREKLAQKLAVALHLNEGCFSQL